MSQILSGESGVKSARVSLNESDVTVAGLYDFESRVGRFDVTGRYQGTFYVQGNVSLVSAGLFWRERQSSPSHGDLPVPRPTKPWVSLPPTSSGGGPIGDILFGSALQATPTELADALQRQVTSASSLGFKSFEGAEVHEYRLLLRLGGLANVVAKLGGGIEVLGKDHPVLIWVDEDNRLVGLFTSIGFEKPAQVVTISLTYSRFNEHHAITPPPAALVETLKQYDEQLRKAWGCTALGAPCKIRRSTPVTIG